MRKLNFILQDYSSKCNVRMRAREVNEFEWAVSLDWMNIPRWKFLHTLCVSLSTTFVKTVFLYHEYYGSRARA